MMGSRVVLRRLGAVAAVSSGAFMLSVAAGAGDAAFGEYLSSECVTCHRADGQDKGIPSIVGWPQDQFVAVMQSYRSKERDNAVMQTIAGRMSDQELAALAAYYGTLKAN